MPDRGARAGIMQGAAEHGTDDVTGRRTYQGATVNRCVALACGTWRADRDRP